jgi:succinate dehydrogenase / fumarate reductase, membrane anchor subunit
MVNKLTNVFSLSGNGLRDWMIQRVSALILAVYTLFLLPYFIYHHDINYFEWQHFFSSTFVRIFTLLALLSLVLHAWIGVWTIATDYLKPLAIRLIFQTVVIVVLIVYLLWGLQILF